LTGKEKSMKCEDISIDGMLSHKNIISEKVVKTMLGHISDMYEIIIKIIDQGKQEGVVIKNIPSEVIACTVIGTMGEYYRLKLFKDDNQIIE